jgi:hypothetical protein
MLEVLGLILSTAKKKEGREVGGKRKKRKMK